MEFFNPRQKFEVHGSKLPHWQQDSRPQFITFRERDSLPQQMLREWRAERDRWLRQNPEPHDDAARDEYRELFTKPIEDALDNGWGPCRLKDPTNRRVLENVLMHSNGDKFEHFAWVIMPNHVHLLCRTFHPIGDLIKIWKGTSARRIEQGSIWQSNYRDTMIRNERHFYRVIHYIRKNPKHLSSADFTLWESDLAKSY